MQLNISRETTHYYIKGNVKRKNHSKSA